MKKPKKQDSNAGERPSDGHILIKKYPNRRLYNTSTSAYIVLDDVVELVKSGTPFVIEDTKTGEDITRTILNQIIFEQEIKPSNFHFPLEFQKQLISMYGDTYGQMVPDYLTESLKLFAAERAEMGQAFDDVVSRNTRAMMDYSQNLARQNMEMFRQSWSMFGMTQAPSGSNAAETPGAETPDEDVSSRESELELIQKQIDALQARLKTLK
ncbi:MAG: polyhydroxyalkanoate synthesis repressor PhaR [Rhizobiaceae bacterium]